MSLQSELHFSVEESVWFQKGQEVSQLLSISLDPDISIQEHDQYISIKGALRLTGEYEAGDDAGEDEENYQYTAARFVNEVNAREDGSYELSHRFPVDITIPRNRISSLDEVYVIVNAFDYDFVETRCLKLTADLSISGISQQISSVPPQEIDENETEENEEEVFTLQQEEQQDSFQSLFREGENTVAVLQNEEQEEEEVADFSYEELYRGLSGEENASEEEESALKVLNKELDQEELYSNERKTSFDELYQGSNQEADEEELTAPLEPVEPLKNVEFEEEYQTADYRRKAEEDLYAPIEVSAKKEAVKQSEEEAGELLGSLLGRSTYDQEENAAYEERAEEKQVVFHKKAEVQQDGAEAGSKSENALYLTKLFSREEEEFSRLKICIVQQNETLDHICERYELSLQQLLRVNTFDSNADLYEGQLVYIPDYSKS
ncbi:stage VI sporulation protein D [Metabacillus lacus]|uniref:stage VI sporulation protein D n=1 Tax=Metabacillus lacus TaxID=1983721 RepID=UPI001478FB85|nr:stage VI sporulation protein D [Metabacillus lacus]